MTVTFGSVGMLLLGMVLGFVGLFAVLLGIVEWNETYHDFNRSYVPATPWRWVVSHRNPVAWPVSYAILRLQLLLAHQKPVSWAAQRKALRQPYNPTSDWKQEYLDNTETGAGQQFGEDAGGEGTEGGRAGEAPATKRRVTRVSSGRGGRQPAGGSQGTHRAAGRQGQQNPVPGHGVAGQGGEAGGEKRATRPRRRKDEGQPETVGRP